jgi:hypothetical protein
MPTTENDRRNLQKPTLEKPSLPDHDRKKDPGMHSAIPDALNEVLARDERRPKGALDESETAPPDQEFGQILESGLAANQGQFPNDPNNSLTSDHASVDQDDDPENRGESLPDIIERNQH